jgi:hypothetical protein
VARARGAWTSEGKCSAEQRPRRGRGPMSRVAGCARSAAGGARDTRPDFMRGHVQGLGSRGRACGLQQPVVSSGGGCRESHAAVGDFPHFEMHGCARCRLYVAVSPGKKREPCCCSWVNMAIFDQREPGVLTLLAADCSVRSVSACPTFLTQGRSRVNVLRSWRGRCEKHRTDLHGRRRHHLRRVQ